MTAGRHPIFARFYTWLSARVEGTEIARHRDELLDGVEGRVVEIGAGNGMNFAHYPATASQVLAVEPEPYLRARAVAEAVSSGRPVRLLAAAAERLPLADASVDAGVASLVLCSVGHQSAALAELRRVIRPGGELRFYEHVRGDSRAHARFQDVIDHVWPLFAGGCHTGRDTARAIEAAGFGIEELRRFDLGPRVGNPAAPHIIGRARRLGA